MSQPNPNPSPISQEADEPLINLELSGEYDIPSESNIDTVIDLFLSYPARVLQAHLEAIQLPTSLIKESLRKRIKNSLAEKRITFQTLVHSLNQLEGWGDQHIYMYRSTEESEDWLSIKKVTALLRKKKLLHLLNQIDPIILPDKPKMTSIIVTDSQVRIQWVEKREWTERVPEKDRQEGDIILRGFRDRVARGITTFDWDLLSGHAVLMIQRLHSGNKYDDYRDYFENELDPLVQIKKFKSIRLSARAMRKIEDSNEVRKRACQREAISGEVINITSRSRAHDVFHDQKFAEILDVMGTDSIPRLSNFYWLGVDKKLYREIHVKLYAKDHRIGIFGACTESEVRYLLSRIRYYCH